MTFRFAPLRPFLVLAATLAALTGINSFLTQHQALIGQTLVATVTLVGFFVAARDRKRAERRRRDEDATLLQRLHLEIELNRAQLLLLSAEHSSAVLLSAEHSSAGLAATQRATDAAQEAFHEANNANTKIADLQRQLETRTQPPSAMS